MKKLNQGLRVSGFIEATCYDKDGNIKWIEANHNLVVDVGMDYILDTAMSGAAQTTTFYCGLKGTGSPAAGDTMASHASWSEDVNYSQANRPTWVEAGISSHALTNAASKAVFSMNGTTTIYGAFITTNSTKGGSTGTLICVGNFASSRAVISGDTIELSYQVGISDDGV
jgi:hypothetical protein